MSESKYELVQKRGYSMLKLRKPPEGYTDIHLTISSDTAELEDGHLKRDTIWMLPHFSFVQRRRYQDVKIHVFMYPSDGRTKFVDAEKNEFRNRTYVNMCKDMLKDQEIADALWEPEKYIK